MSIWNDMDWVLPLRTPFFDGFFELVTLAGYPLFLILFLCFGYFALGSRRFFHTAMLLMAAGLLNSWLKDIGQNPRPDAIYALDGRVGDSYGWPSGHTQIAVVLWGYLAYTLRQNWAYAVAAIFIILQGFSRLYLGVHDLGDVASGFVFGVLCLAAYIGVERNPLLSAKIGAASAVQLLMGLLAVHVIYALIYPTHAGHGAPFWFMGAMTGFLAAHYWRAQDEVRLPGPIVARGALAAGLTALCFVLLIVTSRLPNTLAEDSAVLEYGFGALFGFAAIGLLPFLLAQISANSALRNFLGK
ncbi:MAG: phosphatase PAP2 family protein [Parvibaculales bacterium]